MKAIKSILTGLFSEVLLAVKLSPSDIVNQYCSVTSAKV